MLTVRRQDAVVSGSETVTRQALRLPRPAVVLGALVVASTAVRFGVAQAFTTPWIAPDEMVYALIGESLWSHGTLDIRDLPAPYYSVLTPALVGAPLAALDAAEGIRLAQLLQALAMSLVAVPTYRWARRFTPERWAVTAAALTLAAPAFHYTGFLMTEPLTLTVVTATLLAMARALEQPTTWRYGVFLAWATAAAAVRLQALVVLPAFLLAAMLDAWLARDRARLRPLLWLGALAAFVTVVGAAVVVSTSGELSSRRILGAYTPIGQGTQAAASGLDQIVWHAFAVCILGLGVGALATAAVVAHVLRGRDRDPALRAFACVTLAYGGLLVVQVGLFSASFVGFVAERYLVTVVPLLAIGLCAWIARGAPRAHVAIVPLAALLVAGAALVPIAQVAAPETLVSTPTPAALGALGAVHARVVLVVLAIASAAAVLAVPRRRAWLAAMVVALGLILLSVDSGRRIVDESAHEDRVANGSGEATWLDDTGLRDATLLVTSDRLWTAWARTLFWNDEIRDAVGFRPGASPFPPILPVVEPDEDGTLRTGDGRVLRRSLVVASTTFALDGEKLAERPVGDSETPGVAAWRVAGPVRVASYREGFQPNGDFSGTATVTVFGCRPGTLDLTLLGKSGEVVEARIDGLTVARLETPAEKVVSHRIPAPPYADGSRPCVFELVTTGLTGSTTTGFTPARSSS